MIQKLLVHKEVILGVTSLAAFSFAYLFHVVNQDDEKKYQDLVNSIATRVMKQ
jgi:hypothetical protein